MKTLPLLKASLGLLVVGNILMVIFTVIAKEKLKTCEKRQSYRCPRFTCPIKDPTCGSSPWICPPNSKSCSSTEKICIGWCDSSKKICFD